MIVKKAPDAADNWIVDHIVESDICVTNDIPLAGLCLKKRALVITPKGTKFTEDNIGTALATREVMQQIRELGQTLL